MITKLKSMVASGKPKEAINIVANLFSKTDNEKYNELILLSGQIAKNHGLFSQGLIKLEEYRLSDSKTTYALLSILDSIDPEVLANVEEDKEEATYEKKTKLLFLASQPSDFPQLKLEKEYLEIRNIFKKHQRTYDITEEFNVSIDSFFESINEQDPHIIHFSGFALEENIVLSRKIDRTAHKIPYEFLAYSFKLIKGNTELVFINTENSNLFAKVISRFIPFAIGIKGSVNDTDAISFSSGFYSALAIEKNYESAFEFGKKLLIPDNNGTDEKLKKVKKSNNNDSIAKDLKVNDKFEKTCNYQLFINGNCKGDIDTPEDFYIPDLEQKEPTRTR